MVLLFYERLKNSITKTTLVADLLYSPMKTPKSLYILRHAEAEENSFSGKDYDRILTEKGMKDAETLGQYCSSLGVSLDKVISSSAPRARKTAEIVAKHLGIALEEIELEHSLYDGGVEAYWEALRSLDDAVDSVLICGHNPDLTYLLHQIVGPSMETVKKCDLACVSLPIGSWRELRLKVGTLTDYVSKSKAKQANTTPAPSIATASSAESTQHPNRNRRIFIAVFVFFTLVVALFAVDMARRTTAPWNKPKQLNRVLPSALPTSDSLLLDSLLREVEK